MATTKLSSHSVQGPRRRGGDRESLDLRDDILSADEVARRLNVPKTTLYGWRYKGVGPRSHRVGKHLRYRWSDVIAWLEDLD